ncbi:hypothetical protein ABGS62_00275 [Lactiplantibacillus plantarum]|jgi:hypothetical protein|nr:hypothetical protein [Lactiplantibacillus plantarum]GJI51822.1 hypothetical protein NMZ1139_00500 [Lactiplantibacillus plantarum]
MEKIKDALGTAILFITWCCVNFWPLIVVGTVIITAIIFLLNS